MPRRPRANPLLRAALLAALPGAAGAADFGVYLEDGAGTEIRVATLSTEGGGYSLAMEAAPFTDHFLSMRPFKCIEGPAVHWCHLPYPYANARDLSAGTTDLEYDLLFVWKPAGEYGIDLWRGVYYRIEPEGTGYRGALWETDLDRLGIPPGPGEMRPIKAKDLSEADPESFWLPYLRISPE